MLSHPEWLRKGKCYIGISGLKCTKITRLLAPLFEANVSPWPFPSFTVTRVKCICATWQITRAVKGALAPRTFLEPIAPTFGLGNPDLHTRCRPPGKTRVRARRGNGTRACGPLAPTGP